MNIGHVIERCNECGDEHKHYNHMITTNEGFALTFCSDCLVKLGNKIKNYLDADKNTHSEEIA